jgi:hypothetical protein
MSPIRRVEPGEAEGIYPKLVSLPAPLFLHFSVSLTTWIVILIFTSVLSSHTECWPPNFVLYTPLFWTEETETYHKHGRVVTQYQVQRCRQCWRVATPQCSQGSSGTCISHGSHTGKHVTCDKCLLLLLVPAHFRVLSMLSFLLPLGGSWFHVSVSQITVDKRNHDHVKEGYKVTNTSSHPCFHNLCLILTLFFQLCFFIILNF